MKKRKKTPQTLCEGESQSLDVHQVVDTGSISLPSKFLQYLKAKPGDKLHIFVRNGNLEIVPTFSLDEEIEKFLSH